MITRASTVCANESITQLGCWAHVRRKFIEAQKANAQMRSGKADVAVGLIAKLYAIEKPIRHADTEIRYQVRQRESVPQLKKIREWLDKALHLPTADICRFTHGYDTGTNRVAVALAG